MSIYLNYPSWFLILCVIAGIIYAAALYLRDRSNRHFSPLLIGLLSFLRFGVIAILCFFLLRPFIKSVNRIIEKPIVVIAQDNSSSLLLGGDTSFYRGPYIEQLEALSEKLAADYTVRTYRFGNTVEEGVDDIGFDEPATDFSALTEALYSAYSNRNLGAVIISSDGLYNRGNSPLYDLNQLKAPVYTIAMGDTTARKDALIAEIRNNRLSYLGNRFPIEVVVEGKMLEGNSTTLSIKRSGSVLFEQDLVFNSSSEQQRFTVLLDADQPGLQRYTVAVREIEGEVTFRNNTREVFIDVLDSRQKVLILAAHPHPDVASLRSALSSNENYDVSAVIAEEFEGKIEDYSLCVFHQLPDGSQRGMSAVRSALDKNIPALFVVGKHSNREEFNQLSLGVELGAYRGGLSSMQATFNSGFSLFEISDELKAVLKRLPPLSSPAADLSFSPGLQPLLNQRIGMIETDKPLIAFFQRPESRVGVIAGEGLWRWKLVSYLEKQDHQLFNELLTKSAQYLASKQDRSLFRVKGPEEILESERLIFSAEVYNASYEPVTDVEVRLEILNENGDDFPFTFSPGGSGYRLDAGSLPVGNYTYVAKVNRDGRELTERGEFIIRPLELEQMRTEADHTLLYQLALRNGGEMYFPDQLNQLYDSLTANAELTSSSYEEKQLSDLIHYKWILALLLGLLSAEWLLRKRNGTY